MPLKRKRCWTNEQLTTAVKNSASIRSVLIKIGLVPAGGNYRQVSETIRSSIWICHILQAWGGAKIELLLLFHKDLW